MKIDVLFNWLIYPCPSRQHCILDDESQQQQQQQPESFLDNEDLYYNQETEEPVSYCGDEPGEDHHVSEPISTEQLDASMENDSQASRGPPNRAICRPIQQEASSRGSDVVVELEEDVVATSCQSRSSTSTSSSTSTCTGESTAFRCQHGIGVIQEGEGLFRAQ